MTENFSCDDLPSAVNPITGRRFTTRYPLAVKLRRAQVPTFVPIGDGDAACRCVHPNGSGTDLRNDNFAESRT